MNWLLMISVVMAGWTVVSTFAGERSMRFQQMTAALAAEKAAAAKKSAVSAAA